MTASTPLTTPTHFLKDTHIDSMPSSSKATASSSGTMVPPAEELVQSTVRLVPDLPVTDHGATTTYIRSWASSAIGETLGVPYELGKSGQRVIKKVLESVGARDPSDSSDDESLLPDLYHDTSRLSAQHKHDWELRRGVAKRLLDTTRAIRVLTNDKEYTDDSEITDRELLNLRVEQSGQICQYGSLAYTHLCEITTPLKDWGSFGSSRHNIGWEAHCVAVLSHAHWTSAHQIDKETCTIFEEAIRYSRPAMETASEGGEEGKERDAGLKEVEYGDEETLAGDKKSLAGDDETLLGDPESQLEDDGIEGKWYHKKM